MAQSIGVLQVTCRRLIEIRQLNFQLTNPSKNIAAFQFFCPVKLVNLWYLELTAHITSNFF